MPIFNFVCDDCGAEFEDLVMKRDEVIICPDCSSKKTHKVFTGGSSFVLKGSGWYADGYATPTSKNTQE